MDVPVRLLDTNHLLAAAEHVGPTLTEALARLEELDVRDRTEGTTVMGEMPPPDGTERLGAGPPVGSGGPAR